MGTRSESDLTAFADGAPLMALIGTPARTKILSVFASERGRDLTKSELARQAGVSRRTVYEHLEGLVELGVVQRTRTTGGGHSQRYQFDDETRIGAALHSLEGVTLRRLLELDGDLDR